MEIILKGKKYNFEINGTVGIVWIAQNFAGHEIDFISSTDLMYLLYAVYYTSNKQPLELQEFAACITSKTFNAMSEYFKRRFEELEGKTDNADKGGGELKKD